jgi:hypothetical protein
MPSVDGSIPGLDPNETLYGYTPTKWVCALFIALFGFSTLIHIAQAAKVGYSACFTVSLIHSPVSTLVAISYHYCWRGVRNFGLDWEIVEQLRTSFTEPVSHAVRVVP